MVLVTEVRKLGMSIVKSQRLRENILKLNAGSTDICGKRMVCGTKGPWSYSDFPSPIPIPPQAPAPLRRLHILVRMRVLRESMDRGNWEDHILFRSPPKSMSIMLSKIAKFQSFDETLDALQKDEGLRSKSSMSCFEPSALREK
ncbi:unnamed protein product [Linum trigynum]|uniref:Uncharacterized protein n=1 Tax=Linum trigynum TaxID=586398 RepID=A0AAV2GEX9_9ROSI